MPQTLSVSVLGGDDDHRDGAGLGVLGQLTGRLEAVEAGHDDVHQDHVGLFLAGQGDAVAAVLGLEYW